MNRRRYLIYVITALALSACQSKSQIESNFLGSSAPTTYASQTDNAVNMFAGGTSNGTTWDGTNSYLRLDQTGTATDLDLDSSWTPAWSNIVGYWKLDEAAGSSVLVDHGPNGTHTGTPGGGVTLGVNGTLGTAASLDGSSGYIDIANNAAFNVGSKISFGGWVKYNSAPSNSNTIISKGFNGSLTSYALSDRNISGSPPYYFSCGANSSAGIDNSIYSATQVTDSSGTLVLLGWHHVMCTFDGTRWSIYVDGKLDGTQTFSADTLPSNNLDVLLGGFNYNGWINRFSPVVLDDLAIWNTSLSSTAINSIYQHQSAKYAGTFTSRVMDGLSTSANWTNISWVPTLPFFKELPDAGVSETQANYISQSTDLMNGIVSLWHLDEASGTSGASSVMDASGNGNAGTPVNVSFGAAGKLQSSANFDGNSSVINAAVPSQLGSTDVTIALWAFIGSTSDQGAFIKIGNSTNVGGGDGYALGVGGTQLDFPGNNLVGLFEGIRWINTSTTLGTGWVHVALVIDHSGTPSFFINGTNVVGVFTGNLAASPSSGQNVNVGGYTSSSATNRHFGGRLDEVAIWSRALSSSEVLELYRRSANRIKYQVRTCTQSNCSDDAVNANWKGTDSTNQTYFSELNNTLANAATGAVQAGLPSVSFSNFGGLTAPTHRYFQYRAIMESDDTGAGCSYGSGTTWCSPELQSFTAGPAHHD